MTGRLASRAIAGHSLPNRFDRQGKHWWRLREALSSSVLILDRQCKN